MIFHNQQNYTTFAVEKTEDEIWHSVKRFDYVCCCGAFMGL